MPNHTQSCVVGGGVDGGGGGGGGRRRRRALPCSVCVTKYIARSTSRRCQTPPVQLVTAVVRIIKARRVSGDIKDRK